MTGKLAPMLSGFINVGMGWEWTMVRPIAMLSYTDPDFS